MAQDLLTPDERDYIERVIPMYKSLLAIINRLAPKPVKPVSFVVALADMLADPKARYTHYPKYNNHYRVSVEGFLFGTVGDYRVSNFSVCAAIHSDWYKVA